MEENIDIRERRRINRSGLFKKNKFKGNDTQIKINPKWKIFVNKSGKLLLLSALIEMCETVPRYNKFTYYSFSCSKCFTYGTIDFNKELSKIIENILKDTVIEISSYVHVR